MKSVCTAKKFDELRIMVKKGKAIGLDQLPPTSSVIRGHIQRAYFDIRNYITPLEDPPQLDPLDFGWKDVHRHEAYSGHITKTMWVCG